MTGATACYVYVIECDGFFKVGISSDVEERLASFKSHSPHEFKIVHIRKFDSRVVAFDVEKTIHHELKTLGKHRHGEWFENISKEKIVFVVDFWANRVDHDIYALKKAIKNRISRMKYSLSGFHLMVLQERKIIAKKLLSEVNYDGFIRKTGAREASSLIGVKISHIPGRIKSACPISRSQLDSIKLIYDFLRKINIGVCK